MPDLRRAEIARRLDHGRITALHQRVLGQILDPDRRTDSQAAVRSRDDRRIERVLHVHETIG
jgi:hypothetical protein